MSSIPSSAMHHAKTTQPETQTTSAASLSDTASEWAKSGRETFGKTRDAVIAQVKAHPAGAAAAGAVLVSGIALAALPSLRQRGADGLKAMRKAAGDQVAALRDEAPAKPAGGKGKRKATAA